MSHWGMGNWRGSSITGHIQIELDACSTGTKNPFLACVLTSLTVLLGRGGPILVPQLTEKTPGDPGTS